MAFFHLFIGVNKWKNAIYLHLLMNMKRQRYTAPALLHSKTESYLKLAYSIKWQLAIQWKLNRENLAIIIEIVVHLAKLGAPFRGHSEDDYLK